MPLRGTICCQTGEPSDFEHCMQCSTTGDPAPCTHPFFLIKAMRDNKASRENAGMSATTLQACQRFTILAEDNDYYEDPDDYFARFRGTVLHGGIEQFAEGQEGVISEQRYYRTITVPFVDENGEIYAESYEISGKMDLIYPHWSGGAKLSDIKSGGRRSLRPDMEPLESHIEQINIYRWILADGRPEEPTVTITPSRSGDVVTESLDPIQIEIRSASIWYIKDGGMQEVDVPLWTYEATESHIREILRHGKGMKLPPILPSSYKYNRKTQETIEVRHWKCGYCPLRELCDSLPREGLQWFEGDDDGY